jgi:hypothetical protein
MVGGGQEGTGAVRMSLQEDGMVAGGYRDGGC